MRVKIPWLYRASRSKLLDVAKGRLDACTEAAADVPRNDGKITGTMGIENGKLWKYMEI